MVQSNEDLPGAPASVNIFPSPPICCQLQSGTQHHAVSIPDSDGVEDSDGDSDSDGGGVHSSNTWLPNTLATVSCWSCV